MSDFFGIEATITVAKASMAEDQGAMDTLRNIYSHYEEDDHEYEAVQVFDLDTHTCRVVIDFPHEERFNSAISAIHALVDSLKPHATQAFLVSGENEGEAFEEVEGPSNGLIDEAVSTGIDHAVKAAARSGQAEGVRQAMLYAGEGNSQAVAHIVEELAQWRDNLPPAFWDKIESHVETLTPSAGA